MKRNAHGFTIVELLIVIVVVAILAAISIVAYNGVSNNAHDSAIKNDLANFAKKIQMEHAEKGEYPVAGYELSAEGAIATGSITAGLGVSLKASRSAYAAPVGTSGIADLAYCTGPIVGQTTDGFGLVARSKSGQLFRYSTASGQESLGVLPVTAARACDGLGYPRTMAYGFWSGSWQSWTQ